jgi:hypothetical protein
MRIEPDLVISMAKWEKANLLGVFEDELFRWKDLSQHKMAAVILP